MDGKESFCAFHTTQTETSKLLKVQFGLTKAFWAARGSDEIDLSRAWFFYQVVYQVLVMPFYCYIFRISSATCGAFAYPKKEKLARKLSETNIIKIAIISKEPLSLIDLIAMPCSESKFSLQLDPSSRICSHSAPPDFQQCFASHAFENVYFILLSFSRSTTPA